MTRPPKVHPFDILILGLSVFVLVMLIVEISIPLNLETTAILGYFDIGICIVFLIDFLMRLTTAESKLEYMKWGWIDLISSLPTIGYLRWGRVVRVFRLIRVFRLMNRSNFARELLLKKRSDSVLSFALLASVLLLLFSSIAILQIERSENANIATGEEAVWWSIVTMSTVGYGDLYPVTPEGRVLGTILIVCGIGLFGTFSGFIASKFLTPGNDEQESELIQIRRELQDLKELVRKLER